MSEEVKVASGQPESNGVADQESTENVNESGGPVIRDPEALLRAKHQAVEREKKAKAELTALQEQVEAMRREKLEAEGKDKELIESLKEELTKTKSKVGNLALANLQSQLETEAAKFGCQNPQLLAKAVSLETVSIDKETLRGDQQEIRDLVEAAKQEHPYLFAKAAPKFESGVPSGKQTGVDTSKMSPAELKEYILKNFD